MTKDNLPKPVRERIDELYAGANLTTKKRLDELLRVIQASMVPAKMGGTMHVESMVSSKTKNPVVIFEWNENRGELSPLEARQYCMQILESAEAAIQDAALYRAVVEDMANDSDSPQKSEAMAFQMIQLVRKNRRHFEGGDD